MTALRRAGLVMTVLAMPGCAGLDFGDTRQFLSPHYDAARFNYAAGGRDLAVAVQGDPFGLDPAAFGRAVADAMQGHTWTQPANFTMTPGPSSRPQYRAVVAFDPVGTIGPHTLCQGPVPTAPTTGRMQVHGAFCEGRAALTSAINAGPRPSGVDDPAFQRLMAGLTRDLFPMDNRDFRNDSGLGSRLLHGR